MGDSDANNATKSDVDNLASRIEGRFDGLATTITVAVESALKPVRESIGNLETKVDGLNRKVGSLDARMARRSMEIHRLVETTNVQAVRIAEALNLTTPRNVAGVTEIKDEGED